MLTNPHTHAAVKCWQKLTTVLLAAFMIGQLSAREGWMTDIEAAKKKATEEGKDLLIEFTRSEGCGWCIKLEKEVFSKDAFKQQVAKNYVLVMLNFPRDDNDWSPELKKQNEALLKRYRVRTFPYLVLSDAAGLPYKGMGYRSSERDAYITKLTGLPEQRKKRDLAFARAEELEGEEKARMLEKGLAEVSRKYHREYSDVIAAIAEADPSDASGFVSRVRMDQVKVEMAKLLMPLYKERKFSEIPAAVDAYVSSKQPKGEALQVALLYKVQAHYMAKQYVHATKVSDQIIGINDSSRAARFAKILKKRIERLK